MEAGISSVAGTLPVALLLDTHVIRITNCPRVKRGSVARWIKLDTKMLDNIGEAIRCYHLVSGRPSCCNFY